MLTQSKRLRWGSLSTPSIGVRKAIPGIQTMRILDALFQSDFTGGRIGIKGN